MTHQRDLNRFLRAQEPVYHQVLAELRQGEKRSHWMWFIFPQLAGLGHSAMARRYAIESLDEAVHYLAHPVLGARLLECTQAVLSLNARTAAQIFGATDAMKLRSSATLFARVSPPESAFHRVLEQYFDSSPDQKTIELLGQV